MTVKSTLFGLFFLLSLLAPPVFAGLVIISVVSAIICNLDIALERYGRECADAVAIKPLAIPSNMCVIGFFLALGFALCGFGWGMNPQLSASAVETLKICITILAQLFTLMIFIGSMYKLIKLVD